MSHCSACGTEFVRWRKHTARCKECYNKYAREWHAKNKEKVREKVLDKWETFSRKARSARYGLTEGAFRELLQKHPVCAICGISFDDASLHVDHDHKTGNIRGLLCSRCNQGLGFFKDDPALVANASKYLKDKSS